MNASSTDESPTDTLKTLRPEHPRLLATAADWQRMEKARVADPLLDQFVRKICDESSALIEAPVSERVVTGRRLLAVSRTVLHRVLSLSFAWRATGEKAYAERAEAEMLAAAEFSDWNPSHFLDVAEMSTALAIGYDWLYSALPMESRARIRRAIVEKAITPALQDQKHAWVTMKNNWNQVCLGGLTLGALAIAEDEPDLARQILDLARTKNINGLVPYAPDGVYPEGPGYWNYGTSFQVVLIEALRSALGEDWNLTAAPGFLASADFIMHMRGPTGYFYPFADCGPGRGIDPAYYWFVRELKRPGMLVGREEVLKAEVKAKSGPGTRLRPLLAFWWPEAASATPANTHWSGLGENPVAAWRSAWNDRNALYFAIKAGGADVSHGHMDAGSFILDWGGQRWADDLGMQDYHSIESLGLNLWTREQNSDRWRIFRLNNHSHNTLTIGNQLHNAKGLAVLEKADANGAVIDLTPVFQGQASRVRRTVHWKQNEVVLVDELEGLKPGEVVRWAMTTGAKVEVDGTKARLLLENRELNVLFTAQAAQVTDVSVEKPGEEFNAPNPGKRQLRLETRASVSGTVTIRAEIRPRS